MSHDDGDPTTEANTDTTAILRRFPLTERHWQYSYQYSKWIKRNIASFDAVIIYSLFLAHTQTVARAAHRHGVPYAVRPHGSLTVPDLRNGRLKKLAYLRLLDGRVLHRAKFLYCTGDAESADAETLGYSNTRIIPLGVETPYFTTPGHKAPNQLLYIGRITPKKRLDLIIRAIGLLAKSNLEMNLTIAGPDDSGHQRTLVDLTRQLGLQSKVKWVGYVDEPAKLELFRDNSFFILPSEGENFGIAVAEAMASGLIPILTLEVSHARQVQERAAGFVVGRDAAALAAAIKSAINLTNDERRAMSARASEIAASYSWPVAAEMVVNYFREGEQ